MLESFVWTALAVSLTTGALILLLLALRPLLGRFLAPRFLTALWALLALRLLLPAAVPLPDAAVLLEFSPPAQLSQTAGETGTAQSGVLSPPENQGTLSPDTAPTTEPDTFTPAEENDPAGGTGMMQSTAADAAQSTGAQGVPGGEEDAAAPSSQIGAAAALRGALGRLSPARLLLAVWGIGAALRLFFELFFAARFRRALIRSSVPLDTSALSAQVNTAASSLGLKKQPAAYICARISGPMLVGFLRPVLLLPDGADYPPEDWDCMLRHELTHYRCHHMLYKLMLLLLCCLQWWNPAAYLLRRQADRDLELTCDSWALSGKTADYRARYSRALLDSIAPRRTLGDGCSSCFHREGVRVMKRRLLNVLGKGGRRGSPAALAAGLAVCLLVSSCIVPVA